MATPKDLRVGSANIAKENKAPRTAIITAYKNTDLVGFQEVETPVNRRWVAGLSRLYGKRIFWPGNVHPDGPEGHDDRHGTPANAVPVAYSSRRLQVLNWSVRKVTDGQSGNFPNRYIAVVVFKDKRTGKIFRFANTHQVAQAFTSKPGNRPEWTAAATVLERLAHQWSERPFMAAGDWNRNRWVPKGLRVQFSARGTHGSAHYDDVKHNDRVAARNPRTYDMKGSDHDLYVVDVVMP